ncbi:hypothetical protein CEXT_439741 [Caerostris extrusa]|uniref:Uncharacterized protein n=1 Tax=Caerostris extrusa TaxID=172846 RepID=A0AAV4SKF8_CAEEX|nr:hypothetical protein CEXT_439741 [Caerostris extrusa]
MSCQIRIEDRPRFQETRENRKRHCTKKIKDMLGLNLAPGQENRSILMSFSPVPIGECYHDLSDSNLMFSSCFSRLSSCQLSWLQVILPRLWQFGRPPFFFPPHPSCSCPPSGLECFCGRKVVEAAAIFMRFQTKQKMGQEEKA